MRASFLGVLKQVTMRKQGGLELWYRIKISMNSVFLTYIQIARETECTCVCINILIFLSSVHQEDLEARISSNSEHTKCQRKLGLDLESSIV